MKKNSSTSEKKVKQEGKNRTRIQGSSIGSNYNLDGVVRNHLEEESKLVYPRGSSNVVVANQQQETSSKSSSINISSTQTAEGSPSRNASASTGTKQKIASPLIKRKKGSSSSNSNSPVHTRRSPSFSRSTSASRSRNRSSDADLDIYKSEEVIKKITGSTESLHTSTTKDNKRNPGSSMKLKKPEDSRTSKNINKSPLSSSQNINSRDEAKVVVVENDAISKHVLKMVDDISKQKTESSVGSLQMGRDDTCSSSDITQVESGRNYGTSGVDLESCSSTNNQLTNSPSDGESKATINVNKSKDTATGGGNRARGKNKNRSGKKGNRNKQKKEKSNATLS